jgi:tetratricopeptide (TPR) repeat protein
MLSAGKWQWGMVLFCALFPVFWVIVQRSNLYGGIRHLLFVYPLLAVLAATGWARLWQRTGRKRLVRVSWFLFGLACAGPLVHNIRNHPVEYVYFNKLSGGIKQAWGKYETDYYYHSLGPAVKWFEREILKEKMEGKVVLASSFPLDPFFLRSDNRPELVYVPFNQRGEKNWDYGIFATAYLSPSQLLRGCWPPAGTIHTIRVDGFPVCAIVKRVANHDYQGIRAYSQGDYEEAVRLLRHAADIEPCNLSALLHLGWSFRKSGQLDLSDEAALQLLSIHPESEPARELLIWNRLDLNDKSKAREWAEELFGVNPKYPPASRLLNLTEGQD